MEGFNLDPNLLVNALGKNDNDGMLGGGSGLLWIFLLILLGGGNGMFGNRSGEAMGIEGQVEAAIAKASAAGASDQLVLQAINGNKDAINSLGAYLGTEVNQIQSGITALSSGLCELGYKAGQDTASILAAVNAGNTTLSRQLADCCCATQRAIDGVNYKMAEGFCATNTNVNSKIFGLERFIENKIDAAQAENRAGFQGIRDYMTAEKIATLQQDLQTAQFQISQTAQTQALKDFYCNPCCGPVVTCPGVTPVVR